MHTTETSLPLTCSIDGMMASAGDEGNNANAGAGRGRTQRITIPLPRPLQPGQRLMVRMVPAMQVPGVNGVRVVRPAHAHVHVVNAQQQQQAQQQSPQGQHLLRQQQELQQQIERTRREQERQKEELKLKLKFETVPEIERKEQESLLSWKPIEMAAPTSPSYCVLMYTDEKVEGQEVYKGTDSSCTVKASLLSPGHTYHFTVTASVDNVSGEESARCSLEVPACPPTKPLPPKIGTRSKSNMIVRWNAPQDNGSPITSYELEWDQCTGEWQVLCSDKAKQYKLNHRFLPSTTAQFRLRACNEIGWSEYSEVLLFSSGAGSPSAPAKPHEIKIGPNSIEVGWEAPNANGAEIFEYRLEKDDVKGGHGFITAHIGPEKCYNCTGLEPTSVYKFRVFAHNDKGWSAASQALTLVTIPGLSGPPGAPYLKERATPTTMQIAWAPPKDTGGADVQSYMLQMDSGMVGGEEMTEAYRGPQEHCTIEGLLPGRKYLCQVCALTEAGQGQWSPVAHLRTPATRPSPPSSLCLVEQPTKTTVKLEWGYPLSDGGATITSYTVECRHLSAVSSDEAWRPIATLGDPHTFSAHTSTPSKPSHPTLYHTITQLLPGEEYMFRVSCQNSVGVSQPSIGCKCSTAPGEPDPPSSLEVITITANTAHLNWKDCVCHGCPVESYEVQYSAEEVKTSSLSVVSSHCTISNLLPATVYQTRVKALSTAGPSEWSVMLNFTTTPSTPSPPTHLTMVSRTPYSILIAWASPHCHGSPITAYHVECSSGQSATQSVEVSPMETQYTIVDLKPNTSYRYRLRAENSVGKGSFGSYGTSSTLPPPPAPPLLTLSTASHHTLKVTWGKKTNRTMSYVLHMATQGKQFHEVYSGSGMSHKLSRLQPDTEYIMRIAAVSESGQGVWSDDITFMTTPTPPPIPTGVVLRQESNETMHLSWQSGGDFSSSVRYEVQVKSPSLGHDFVQAYKGDRLDCTIPVSSYEKLHEARVRCWATCSVNGRDEQIWSSFSPTAHCQCVLETKEKVPCEEQQEETDSPEMKQTGSFGLSPQVLAMVVFVIVTLLTLILAFVLGQYV